tara:strand:- start:650 stop:799 length:150 start_codon:yes stop_codon:yes gene_type:complete
MSFSPYLKPTNYSGGRDSNDKPPFKERVIIFLIALLPLIIALLLHKIGI